MKICKMCGCEFKPRPANNEVESWVPSQQTFEEWKAENGIAD